MNEKIKLYTQKTEFYSYRYRYYYHNGLWKTIKYEEFKLINSNRCDKHYWI